MYTYTNNACLSLYTCIHGQRCISDILFVQIYYMCVCFCKHAHVHIPVYTVMSMCKQGNMWLYIMQTFLYRMIRMRLLRYLEACLQPRWSNAWVLPVTTLSMGLMFAKVHFNFKISDICLSYPIYMKFMISLLYFLNSQ